SDVTSDVRQGTAFRLHIPGKSRPIAIRIKVHGTHNVTNALAAAAVGAALALSGSMIAQGLGRFRPASMRAAVQLLAQWNPARERIAVLGDMLELGPETRQMHRDVGQFLATQRL